MAFFLRKPLFPYLLLLSILCIERIVLLFNFGFQYVGTDDLVFWMGAADYANGIFHEPYFYGQNYNFMLEALFAVPLVKLQVPLNYALPVSSTFISLFPFVLFSVVLFRNKYTSAAFMFLAIPLCLPVEYDLTCSMARGFLQGLFFSGFFVYPLLHPGKRTSWLIAGLALSFGYVTNPNSLIAAFPICIYLLIYNYKQTGFYLISFVSLLPALIAHFYAQRFYEIHPDYNMHPMMKIEYSFSGLINNLGQLDTIFTFFTPIFWLAGWLVVILILVAGLFIWKSNKAKGTAILMAGIFIIVSLGINKINDRLDNFLLSSSRMYLGIPLVATTSFFWIQPNLKMREQVLCKYLLIICVTVFCLKLGISNMVIKNLTLKPDIGAVAIKKIEELKCDCEAIKAKAKESNAELVVFSSDWEFKTTRMAFYTYGCPLLTQNMPSTLLSNHERRTWVYEKEIVSTPKNLLFYGNTWIDSSKFERLRKLYNFDEKKFCPFEKVYLFTDRPPILTIKNNQLSLDSLYFHLTGSGFSR